MLCARLKLVSDAQMRATNSFSDGTVTDESICMAASRPGEYRHDGYLGVYRLVRL